MSVKAFVDTNVLLYLLSADASKADRAEAVMPSSRISVQVLNEITHVTRRKFNRPWQEIHQFLAVVRAICPVEPLTVETHDKGRQIAERYGLSTYDAMIVAAALLAGCDTLYSEDMQAGLLLDGQLRIVNPFASANTKE